MSCVSVCCVCIVVVCCVCIVCHCCVVCVLSCVCLGVHALCVHECGVCVCVVCILSCDCLITHVLCAREGVCRAMCAWLLLLYTNKQHTQTK